MAEHFSLRLADSRMLAPSVRHMAFERADGAPFAFVPGQFVQVHFHYADGKPTKRSYSVATIGAGDSSPVQRIEIAVSYVEGGAATALLGNLEHGETIEISGPYGRFCLMEPDANRRYVLVATGTGVTPYRSMLPQLKVLMAARNIEVALVYGARNESELLYGEEFEAFAQENSNFHFYACFSRTPRATPRPRDRAGHVQVALREIRPDPAHDIAYLCGNPNMVDEAFTLLKESGLAVPHIRREKYISSRWNAAATAGRARSNAVTKRNIFRLVLALAFLAYVGYSQLRRGADEQAVPARVLLPPVPTNANAFTLGKLEFKRCELTQKRSGATTAAYCAPFQVAENPDSADGRKIDLHLALIKADAEAADTDFVVFLAGGPGQAAIENWPQVAPAFAPLRKHHHILLLDQRGTGGSNALSCGRADKDEPADAAEAGASLDEVRRVTRECLTQVQEKADPRYYTTTLAAHDLEAVRQALGAPQFDLVGVSYGTRMAQQYLMRYPDGVRSLVLDSVAPNELVFGAEFAENLDDALKAQFSLCTKTPACAKAFPDPYASLIKLRDELRAKPQNYDFRDPVTFAPTRKRLDDYALAGLVRLFAYSPETAALLPLSIAEGLKGNYTPLAGQSQLLTGDLSELRDNGMQTSVICAEDADLLTERPQDKDTVLGTMLIDVIRAQCEVWPRGTRPADFHAPLKSAKPVLVLEGELDPVTPPKYGEQVMKGLTNARLLIAKGQGHNVIGRGCIPRLVAEFVDHLAPKDLDTHCADVLGPTPAFIDFNGAAP